MVPFPFAPLQTSQGQSLLWQPDDLYIDFPVAKSQPLVDQTPALRRLLAFHFAQVWGPFPLSFLPVTFQMAGAIEGSAFAWLCDMMSLFTQYF